MLRKAPMIVLVLIITTFLGDIASVIAAQIVNKEQILFSGQNLDIGLMSYRYSGPYSVASGKTIYVEWAADRLVSVYILNEVDWETWPKYGGPSSYRFMKTAQSGNVQFAVQYVDNFYIVIMGLAGSAACVYTWTEKLIWRERIAGNLTIMIQDSHGAAISSAYVKINGPESREGYTDLSGKIIFLDIAPGQYTITSSKSGFQTATRTLVVCEDTTTQTRITLTQLSSELEEGSEPAPKSYTNLNILSLAILTVICTVLITIITFYIKRMKQENKRKDSQVMKGKCYGTIFYARFFML